MTTCEKNSAKLCIVSITANTKKTFTHTHTHTFVNQTRNGEYSSLKPKSATHNG